MSHNTSPNMIDLEMADSAREGNSKARVSELISVFEQAARSSWDTTEHRNPDPLCEPMEVMSKVHAVGTQLQEEMAALRREKLVRSRGASTEGHVKNRTGPKDFMKICDESQEKTSRSHLQMELDALRSKKMVKSSFCHETTSTERSVKLETEVASQLRKGDRIFEQEQGTEQRKQLQMEMDTLRILKCVKSKCPQEETAELCSREQQYSSVEHHEENLDLTERCVELEGEKTLLLEEKAALENKVAELCQRQREEQERSVQDLEKEIAALRSSKGALQEEISKLQTQTPLMERCIELEAEKHCVNYERKALEAELAELREKLEPQWLKENFEELQKEIAVQKQHKDTLQEEIECVKVKLQQQAAVKQHCIKLEDARKRVCAKNDCLQLQLMELSEKLETDGTMEHCLEGAKGAEKDIAEWKSQMGVLQEELERAKIKLQQHSSLKERCVELQAEKTRLENGNKTILQNISTILEKTAREKSRKQDLDVMEVSKHALEKEKELLIEHKEKLKKKYEAEKIAAIESEMKLKEIDQLKCENLSLQEDVVYLRSDILRRRSVRDCHRDISKEGTQLRAKNKQLRKTVEKLEKKLNKLQPVEEEHENFQQSLDELQEENYDMREKIYNLNEDITDKKMVKGRLKSLKAEWKMAVQIHHDLEKELSWWKGVQLKQQPLLEEKEAWEEKNMCVWQQNRRLRSELEEEFVKVHDCEVQEILTRALKTQHEETDSLNQGLTQEIAALRSHTGALLEELERTKAQLQQASAEERSLELQAERDRIQEENELLRSNIAETIESIANEKSWEQKCDVMQVSKNVLESENKQLKEHLRNLTKEHEALPSAEFEYTLRFEAVDNLGRDNYHLLQSVHDLTKEIQSRRFTHECHKGIAKRDAQVSARNKELRKRVEKLQKELQKLQPVEEEHQKLTQSLDKLRKDHCSLHDKIQALNKDITSKEMLQVHMKSLEAEKLWLLKRESALYEKRALLEQVHLEQGSLAQNNESWEEETLDKMRSNEKLRIKFKKMFMEVAHGELLKMSNSFLMTQCKEMETLNEDLEWNIEELQIHED